MRSSWVCLVALFNLGMTMRSATVTTLRSSAKGGDAAVCSLARLYATSELNVAKPAVLFASFSVNHSIPRNAASRPTVCDKDQLIKSLRSMSRDKIFKTFSIYIKRYKSLIFSRESCNI